MIYTNSDVLIAKNFIKISSNKRGDYYEMSPLDMEMKNLYIPREMLWKITKEGIRGIDYVEFRTIKDDVKVYFQVDTKFSNCYAEYAKNLFYVNCKDVFVI